MVNESKRQRYEKAIAQFCLMDDTFMAKVFENNIPDTEMLLQTILENDKIKIIKLLHDFFCYEPDNMYNKQLAARTRYFKEDEGGMDEMCELMEALAKEEAMEAQHEVKIEIAERMLLRGMSVADAAALTELAEAEVSQIAVRLAQKHSA